MHLTFALLSTILTALVDILIPTSNWGRLSLSGSWENTSSLMINVEQFPPLLVSQPAEPDASELI